MKRIAFAFLALMSLCLSPFNSSAETLDEPTMKAKLSEILGDKTTWMVPALKSFKRDAPCEEVKKALPALACNSNGLSTVSLENNALLDSYEFSFDNGKLYRVTLIFKTQLDKELFKKVFTELAEAKWGALSPEDKKEEIYTWVNSNSDSVQSTYMVDHWEIKIVAPN